MLSQEENELLTRTGPGTPGGELLRRYWQPVALSLELIPGGPPVPIRVMGEDLTLFRDEAGNIGLLGIHCAHRAADLSYGRIEDGGLRCLYHGWLYDVNGKCLEQPGEPEGSTFKDKVRQLAYPCHEAGELIFAYLGPDDPPLFPNYEFLTCGVDYRHVTKVFTECNYLQGHEGGIDPQHLSFLHSFVEGKAGGLNDAATNSMILGDHAPRLETEETDFGFRIYSVRDADAERYVRVTYFLCPSAAVFPTLPGEYGVQWFVPIDDTHSWRFVFVLSTDKPFDRKSLRESDSREITGDYHLMRNPGNRFLQDRDEMRTRTFTGLGPNFAVHDNWATVGEGAIQDRTTEHLGYTDKVITHARRFLLDGIREVQEGGEAPGVVRDDTANAFHHLRVVDQVVDASVDWRNLWKEASHTAP